MMRRFMLIVAALVFASPVLAVDVNAVKVGSDGVAITYTGGAGVRAFALDIDVNNGATITGISGFYSGEGAGYGIFPGNFRDIIVPTAPNWAEPNYTPVAPAGDPGAAGAIPGAAITIELGSLYDGDGNKPPADGTLCVLTIDAPNGSCDVCIAVNPERGNVVLDDANEAATNLPICRPIEFAEPECYPSGLASYQDWLDLGKPDCWCGAAAVDPECKYQCYGDAACDGQILDWRIYSNDLVLLANNWKKKGTDPMLDPCADVAHDGQILDWRVYSNDLVLLANNWKAKGSALDLLPACPTQ